MDYQGNQEGEGENPGSAEIKDRNEVKIYLVAKRYTFFREAREMLRHIAQKSGTPLNKHLHTSIFSPLSGSIQIDESGYIRYEPPRSAQILHGVKAEGIRECKVCGLIFRAGRLDQKTCSKKCGKVLRTRRWREKYLPRSFRFVSQQLCKF